MINLRDEILKALPIPNYFTWYENNWSGMNWHIWAEVVLKMEEEGIVKIERGRVELVEKQTTTK